MQTRTHERLARRWLPGISRDAIVLSNYVIDNPGPQHFAFQNMYSQKLRGGGYYNPYDLMGLGQRSIHRRVNHDPVSALWAGYQVAGADGARAAALHIALDQMSDNLKGMYGARKRDLIEAFINALD